MTDPAADPTDWRRLSAATLLVAFTRLGPRALQLLPAFAAIGIAGRWALALALVAAALLASLVGAWLSWARFRYAVTDDAIIVEQGVLSRQHRLIPFDRIQDVSIEQGLLARALGVARAGFETGAGGKEDDAALDLIALGEAERLRTTIRAHRADTLPATAPTETGDTAASAGAGRLLFAMTPRQLIVAGVFNFSLAGLAVAAAGARFFDDFLPFDLYDPDDWVAIARTLGLDSWVLAHRIASGILALIALLLVGFATGIVTMLLRNWDFQLLREARTLRRRRGLTRRTDTAIPLHRVQAAIVQTGFLRRHFGWHQLRLQTLAPDGKDEQNHEVVPFARLESIDPVLGECVMPRPDSDTQWRRSHAAAGLGGYVAALAATLGGLASMAFGSDLGVAGPVLGVLIALGTWLHVRSLRHVLDGERVVIARGWWNPRMTILPLTAIQSIDVRTNALNRRLDVASLQFGVPGGGALDQHRILAIPVGEAAMLRATILAAATRVRA